LEIHQQLASTTKLFCACPITKSEELPYSFERRLRPAQSETGGLDPAAVFEFAKGRSNVYRWSPESSCLVEADEEPPHPLNDEAVDISLSVAGLLHSNILNEAHVMRKIVIDGSNTGGFQRTAVVALGGYLDVEGLRVGVQTVTLEEDAARILGEDVKARYFSLDRLGIPLVEIALDPITGTPEMIGNVALHLGRALRSTGRVARGLGTIRQDMNISVMGGRVVEVKGVQKLNLVPKVVVYEATRQLGLIKVAEELAKKNVTKSRVSSKDVSAILRDTSCRILHRELEEGGIVVCVSAAGFSGLLGWEPYPGIRLGKELAEVARANSIGGVIHSDEFALWGLTPQEEDSLRRELASEKDSGLVLLAGDAGRVEKTVPLITRRIEQALDGVPAETRAATDKGETRFMRPRPGAQRMYPETDIPEVKVGKQRLMVALRRALEPWEETVKRYERRYSLSKDLALKLFDSDYWEVFEGIVARVKLEPSYVASTLVDLPVRLAREGVPESALGDEFIAEMIYSIDSGVVAKEAAPDILRAIGKGEARSVREAIESLHLEPIEAERLSEMIESVLQKERAMIAEKGEGAFSPLMGELMAQVRGRADGRIVSRLLREKLASAVGEEAKS